MRSSPGVVSGRRVKIRYMTQPKARPSFFVLFGNSVDKIPESYKRYLVNGARETLGLIGVSILLSMRSASDNPFAEKAALIKLAPDASEIHLAKLARLATFRHRRSWYGRKTIPSRSNAMGSPFSVGPRSLALLSIGA
jgi:KH-domain-like of EngA bacterial GTPase enzymes, C-terminal